MTCADPESFARGGPTLTIFSFFFYEGREDPINHNGPRRDKTCLRGFRQSKFQTSLLSYRDLLKIEISPVASLHTILTKKQITKALIRLRGCAGWSAPVLFANP